MKHSILLAISASLLAGTALAGSTEAPVFPVTQIAPAAAAADWSGFYAGGMVSFNGTANDLSAYESDVFQFIAPITGNASVGGFVGYDFQFGSFVLGGELAITSRSVSFTNFPNQYFGPVTDLKMRAGYSFGKVMAYGVVGASFSTLADYGDSPMLVEFKTTGLNYGVGVEYFVHEKMFVGAEFLARNLSGNRESLPLFSISTTIQSAQLRAGWKF